MKYSSAEKSEAIKRYQHGEPIHEISQATGISKSTLYSWIKPYSQIVSCDHMSVTLKDYDDLKRHAEKLECMIKVQMRQLYSYRSSFRKISCFRSHVWAIQRPRPL